MGQCFIEKPLSGRDTGTQEEEPQLHMFLAMHAEVPYKELPSNRVPCLHRMDACMALAWRESGAVEGAVRS